MMSLRMSIVVASVLNEFLTLYVHMVVLTTVPLVGLDRELARNHCSLCLLYRKANMFLSESMTSKYDILYMHVLRIVSCCWLPSQNFFKI